MAEKTTNKKEEQQKNTQPSEGFELLENPEALQEQLDKTQAFINKHKSLITKVLASVVGIIVGMFFYNYYKDMRDQEAQVQLFPAVFYFEKDSLDKAMQGDGNFTDGFAKISEEYGLTKAGNLSNFYAGVIALKKGDYDQAITYLKDFSSDDYLLQARAYCLIGDAYVEKNDLSTAANYYEKAANYNPNPQFTPTYLMKLGMVLEEKGDKEKAKDAYREIVTTFKKSSEFNEAKKALARLGEMVE
ncbi:MAG: tetratricopeptide repeat protein [Flammeovirgaceae bacterium]|nr:tetratricopeptide repeat protein [Flammeovirgaceae bacterium]MDW8287785.1 tetratricopeptide repeat protein [Flammeovirgaceae bacterium]